MTAQEIYQRFHGSGLHTCKSEDPYFSWHKCDNCGGLAGDRFEVEGYLSLEDAKAGKENLYQLELCPKCYYELHYGSGSYEG